jgi:regulatory protein
LLILKRKAPGPTQANSEEAAFQRALKILSYRSRSQAEMRHKLTELGYSRAIAERTLEKLADLNYLNDESFARNWAQSRTRSRGYGAKRLEQELKAKGIEPGLRRRVIGEACDRETERNNAKRLLERKFRDEPLNDPKILRRAVAFLQRRGYSGETIFDLLRHRWQPE